MGFQCPWTKIGATYWGTEFEFSWGGRGREKRKEYDRVLREFQGGRRRGEGA